mmetsp:Transcript_25356/g.52369  ORF Transcript_25356/g.52369 Transcript_25356/m.52369 type:complete len:528 (+) Transcript_25356:108-1691(+)|eukprot:CAMPEP_0171376446 /NCGR_PEP_ID=MMETSP0879-20121228/18731_1 /TAXON_ID=67004 /ORGANISM="Thalassiosira weissflogii, Strain CCMP1336" /LENGTH=527 /DNA_ID=CAMNT_0011886287 /DNA_START=83 /DNA_END=1666 /DNA_ORIENTATION=+
MDSKTKLTLSVVNLDLSVSEILNENKTSFTPSLSASDHPLLPVGDIAKIVLNQCPCASPTDVWEQTPRQHHGEAECHERREKLDKSITRYLREPDRWTAFTSLLLKSVAFHRTLPAKIQLKDRDDDITKKDNILPIVDLPRTKFNRPYIPMIYPLLETKNKIFTGSSSEGEGGNENVYDKFNISHQYPYVALVQHNLGHSPSLMPGIRTERREKKSSENEPFLLGLDLVTFQRKLNDYIPTIHDYLSSFEGSFTLWEWERINYQRVTQYETTNEDEYADTTDSSIQRKNTTTASSFLSSASPFKLFSFAARDKSIPVMPPTKVRNDASKLKEFYLRWAMKEAYTKALGLGMNMEFDSFETRLVGVDDIMVVGEKYADAAMEGDLSDGIWNAILRNASDKNDGESKKKNTSYNQFSVMGQITIKTHSKGVPKTQMVSNAANSSIHQTKHSEIWEFIFIPLDDSNGCICICRGPLKRDENFLRNGFSKNLKPEHRGGCIGRDKVVLEWITLWDLVKFHIPDFDFNFLRS